MPTFASTSARNAFAASRSTYGSPRLLHALRGKGVRHGRNRIARLMREQHVAVPQKRRFVPRITTTDKTAPAAPNHLLKRTSPQRLNKVWVTDITYLSTREGWLYLAAEMDLSSRRILGWSTHDTLATELPNAALEHALQTRGSSPDGQLDHSDRGCQYTSAEFRQHLKLRGITASISRTTIHLVLDKYATHETPKVAAWLKKRPCYHLYFTPHEQFLAQSDRALVCQNHRATHPPRGLQKPR